MMVTLVLLAGCPRAARPLPSIRLVPLHHVPLQETRIALEDTPEGLQVPPADEEERRRRG